MDNGIPIIRIEFERMRHALSAMLTEESVRLDEMVQKAIAEFCTEQNLKRIITAEVYRCLDATIKDEVQSFFRYDSEGRKIIAAAVKKKLLENETYTPLDDAEEKP